MFIKKIFTTENTKGTKGKYVESFSCYPPSINVSRCW